MSEPRNITTGWGPAAVIADADLEFSIHYEGDSYIAEIPGARSAYACTEHDDCREHPEVGVACYRERCKEEKR